MKRFSHEITVARPADEALLLFTPKGEEQWVPGWAPDYIEPASGETVQEMTFRTGEGDETTYWTCLQWQPQGGHVRYLRLTPVSRLAFVDVQCNPIGQSRTRVRVSYEYQSLGKKGEDYINSLDSTSYACMIGEWAELIKAMENQTNGAEPVAG